MTTTAKSKRTAGEWREDGGDRIVADVGKHKDRETVCECPLPFATTTSSVSAQYRSAANRRTIALAGNAANAVDAMGLDGDAALRELPELLRIMRDVELIPELQADMGHQACVARDRRPGWQDAEKCRMEIRDRIQKINRDVRGILSRIRNTD